MAHAASEVGVIPHEAARYDEGMDISVRCSALWNRALLIFGSEDKAVRWMHTPLSELRDQTPEEVLEGDPNTEAVDAILDRIEYGVFS